MPLMPKAPGAGGKGQGTPSLCHSPACSLPAPPCPACTFLHCPATDPAKPSPDLSPLISPGSCFPHNSGLQAGGGEELPAQIGIPYLGRAGGEAENPHNTDANNCKKQQGNGQDDPEGPGGSWEVTLGWRPACCAQEGRLCHPASCVHHHSSLLPSAALASAGHPAKPNDLN